MTRNQRRILMICCQEIGPTTGSGVVVYEVARWLCYGGNKVTILYGSNEKVEKWSEREPNLQFRKVGFCTSVPEGLDFPVVGMSNEMPYFSSTFASLKLDRLDRYIRVWLGAIQRAVTEVNPDVIHVHHLWLLSYVARLAAPSLPIVVSLHGTDLHRCLDAPHIKQLVSQTVHTLQRFIALSGCMVADAQREYNIISSNFSVLGNGFNPQIFSPNAKPAFSSPALPGISESSRLVTFVGKFAVWKGLRHLLRAFTRVRPCALSKSILVIVGTGPAAVVDQYAAEAKLLGLGKRVLFVGHKDQYEVAQILNRTNAFVLPSFKEPYGLALLEALGCGCRIVAANQGGPAEFVPASLRKFGDALLIEGLSSLLPSLEQAATYEHALADAISIHLDRPLTLADRQRISSEVANFSWEKYVDRLVGEYAWACS